MSSIRVADTTFRCAGEISVGGGLVGVEGVRKIPNRRCVRSLPVMKLSGIVDILDEQKFGEVGKHVATGGVELEAHRARVRSSFALSGPRFST